MIYVYECGICNHTAEIAKHHSEIDSVEFCPSCNVEMHRVIQASNFKCYDHMYGEWNPGLGEHVHSEKHKKQIMKEKGLVEIGNEQVDKFIESPEKRQEREWKDV